MLLAFGGPTLGHMVALLGLCLAYVEQKIPSFHWAYVQTISTQTYDPDLRKIRSGLNKTALLGHVQPGWAYPVPSWGNVGPLLKHVAHPLLGYISPFFID